MARKRQRESDSPDAAYTTIPPKTQHGCFACAFVRLGCNEQSHEFPMKDAPSVTRMQERASTTAENKSRCSILANSRRGKEIEQPENPAP